MKEELQLKLVEVIDAIQATASKAGEFALTQLPQIAQEYVIYGRVKSVVVLFVLTALGGICLGFAYWAYKLAWKDYDSDTGRGDSNIFIIAAATLIGLLSFVRAVLGFDYLVWFAPKVWLIKELANLVK